MAGTRRYLNTADQINLFRYKIKVPAYVLSQPDVYMSGEVDPIYSSLDPAASVVTVASINRMCQIYQAKALFAVCSCEDAVEIFHWIDRYLESAENRIQAGDQQFIAYCRGFLEFREWYYRRIFLRALNKNADLKKDYLAQSGNIGSILAIFSGLAGMFSAAHDPLKALATPPITLPALPDTTSNGPREMYAIDDAMVGSQNTVQAMDPSLYA